MINFPARAIDLNFLDQKNLFQSGKVHSIDHLGLALCSIYELFEFPGPKKPKKTRRASRAGLLHFPSVLLLSGHEIP